ncbi:MAG TPA: DEAD/DEAH box helicase [Gammaproteobacteria bacterium]|nr:DEAD/DEAH box helicase [Gammaproteobacteria bacterium]
MATDVSLPQTFAQFALIPQLLKALNEVGYETPTPIQGKTIPLLLEGKDVVGQAQTGTGKTAAFALPLLSHVDLKNPVPQILVLAPTRELAIQVAEAFQKYAHHMRDFRVLPIYGGQSYAMQLRPLKRGVHVVVGTPGRVMDHMRRGTLKLDHLQALVLDEADEMLRMGFIDDVEWVLERTPEHRQIALFSATMPPAIRKIAERYLNKPLQIMIKVKTSTAETIHQRFWMVSGHQKLDALTRVLESEEIDGVIVFVRTKTATIELVEKLAARGFSVAALNGDIAQNLRERTIDQLKKGRLDILVATDVAARGLDVERISHVINYDVPHDTESYIHRVGRTGRAGRSGEAILFIAPREQRMLYAIERATGKKIERYKMVTTTVINDRRINAFKQRITDTLEADDGLKLFADIVAQYRAEHNIPTQEIAAAMARMAQGDQPLLLAEKVEAARRRPERHSNLSKSKVDSKVRKPGRVQRDHDNRPLQRYRLEVGKEHGAKAGNIVGAIANETGLDSAYIGDIRILDSYTTVDLPAGLPKALIRTLQKTWVCGQKLNARPLAERGREGVALKRSSVPAGPVPAGKKPLLGLKSKHDRILTKAKKKK